MGIHLHDKDMHDIDWLELNFIGILAFSHGGYDWLETWTMVGLVCQVWALLEEKKNYVL